MERTALPTANDVTEKYVDKDVLAAIRAPRQSGVDPIRNLEDPSTQMQVAMEASQQAEGRVSGLRDAGRMMGGAALQATGGIFDALAFVTGDSEGSWVSDTFQALGDGLFRAGDNMTGRVSPDRLDATWEFEGNLFEPDTWNVDRGEGTTVQGAAYTFATLFGSFLPMITASLASSGAAGLAGAGVAGRAAAGYVGASGTSAGVLAGSAMDTAVGVIRQAHAEGQLQDAPYWRMLMEEGFSEEEALQKMEGAAAQYAVLGGAALGALGGVASNFIFRGHFAQAALGSRNAAARVAGSVAVASAEEGVQEVAENAWARFSAQQAGADHVNVWETSFADFMMGAIAGGGLGAIGGVSSRRTPDAAETPPGETPEGGALPVDGPMRADVLPEGADPEAALSELAGVPPQPGAQQTAEGAAQPETPRPDTSQDVTRADGSPFASEASAKRAITRRGDQVADFDIMQVEGGFVARPRQDAPAVQETAVQETAVQETAVQEAPAQEAPSTDQTTTGRPDREQQEVQEAPAVQYQPLERGQLTTPAREVLTRRKSGLGARNQTQALEAVLPHLPVKAKGRKFMADDMNRAVDAFLEGAEPVRPVAEAGPVAPVDAAQETAIELADPDTAPQEAPERLTLGPSQRTDLIEGLPSEALTGPVTADVSPVGGTVQPGQALPTEALTGPVTSDVTEVASREAQAAPMVRDGTATSVSEYQATADSDVGPVRPAPSTPSAPTTPRAKALAVFNEAAAARVSSESGELGVFASEAEIAKFLRDTNRTELLARAFDEGGSARSGVEALRSRNRQAVRAVESRNKAIEAARKIAREVQDRVAPIKLVTAAINSMTPGGALSNERVQALRASEGYASTDARDGFWDIYRREWDKLIDAVYTGDQSRIDKTMEALMGEFNGMAAQPAGQKGAWSRFSKLQTATREVRLQAFMDAASYANNRLGGLVTDADAISKIEALDPTGSMLQEARFGRAGEEALSAYENWRASQTATAMRALMPDTPRDTSGRLLLQPSWRTDRGRRTYKTLAPTETVTAQTPVDRDAILSQMDERALRTTMASKLGQFILRTERTAGLSPKQLLKLERRRAKGEKPTKADKRLLRNFTPKLRSGMAKELLRAPGVQDVVRSVNAWRAQNRVTMQTETTKEQERARERLHGLYLHVPKDYGVYYQNAPQPLEATPVTGFRSHDLAPKGLRTAARGYMIGLQNGYTDVIEVVELSEKGRPASWRVRDSGDDAHINKVAAMLETEGAKLREMPEADPQRAMRQHILETLARDYASRIAWRYGAGARPLANRSLQAANQARRLEGDVIGTVPKRGVKGAGQPAAVAIREYEKSVATALGLPVPASAVGAKSVDLAAAMRNRFIVPKGAMSRRGPDGKQHTVFYMPGAVPSVRRNDDGAYEVSPPVEVRDQVRTKGKREGTVGQRLYSYDMRDVEVVDIASLDLTTGQYIEAVREMAPVVADAIGSDLSGAQVASVLREVLREGASLSPTAQARPRPAYEPGRRTEAPKQGVVKRPEPPLRPTEDTTADGQQQDADVIVDETPEPDTQLPDDMPDADAIEGVLGDIDLSNIDLNEIADILGNPRQGLNEGTVSFMSDMQEMALALYRLVTDLPKLKAQLPDGAAERVANEVLDPNRTRPNQANLAYLVKLAFKGSDVDVRFFNTDGAQRMAPIVIHDPSMGVRLSDGGVSETVRPYSKNPPDQAEIGQALIDAIFDNAALIEAMGRAAMEGEVAGTTGRPRRERAPRTAAPEADVTPSNPDPSPTSQVVEDLKRSPVQEQREPLYGHYQPEAVPERPSAIPQSGWEVMSPLQRQFSAAFGDVFSKRMKIVEAGLGNDVVYYRDVFLADGAGTGKTMQYLSAVKQVLGSREDATAMILVKNVGGARLADHAGNAYMQVALRAFEVEALGLDKGYGLVKHGQGRDAYYTPQSNASSRIMLYTHDGSAVSQLVDTARETDLLVLDESHDFDGGGGLSAVLDATRPKSILHVSATPSAADGKGVARFAEDQTLPLPQQVRDAVVQGDSEIADLVSNYPPVNDTTNTPSQTVGALAKVGAAHSRHKPRRQSISYSRVEVPGEIASAYANQRGQDGPGIVMTEVVQAFHALRSAMQDVSPTNRHVGLLFYSMSGKGVTDTVRKVASMLEDYARSMGVDNAGAARVGDAVISAKTNRPLAGLRQLLVETGADVSRVGFLQDGTTPADLKQGFYDGTYDIVMGTYTQMGTGIDFDARDPSHSVTLHLAGLPQTASLMTQALGRHDRASTRGQARTIFYEPVRDGKVLGKSKARAEGLRAKMQELNQILGITPEGLYQDTDRLPMDQASFKRAIDRSKSSQALHPSPTDGGLRDVLRRGSAREALEYVAEKGTAFERAMARRFLPHVTSGVTVELVDGASDSAPLLMTEDSRMLTLGAFMPTHPSGPRALIADGAPATTQTFLHEMAHAASLFAMSRDAGLRDRVAQVMSRVSKETRQRFPEAFDNAYEFVANAMSNNDLQSALRLDTGLDRRGVLRRLWDTLKSYFGFGPAVTNRVFDDTMQAVFVDAAADAHPVTRDAADYLPEILYRTVPENATVEPENKLSQFADMRAPTNAVARGVWEKMIRGALKVSKFTHVAEFGDPTFERHGAGNPLRQVMDTIRAQDTMRNNYQRAFQRGMGKRWDDYVTEMQGRMVEGPFGPENKVIRTSEVAALGSIRNAANYANINFSKPVNSTANDALRHRNKAQRMRAQAIWDVYKPLYDKAISARGREMYQELDAHYAREFDDTMATVIGTYLDIAAPDLKSPDESFTSRPLKELQQILEDQDALGTNAVVKGDDMKTLRSILKTNRRKGSYSPLVRHGEFVIKIEEEINVEDGAAAEQALRDYPGAVYKPINSRDPDDGGTVTYTSVTFFESRQDAEAFRAEAKALRQGEISNVMRRDDALFPEQAGVNHSMIQRFNQRIQKRAANRPSDQKEQSRIDEALMREFALAMLDLAPESNIANQLRNRKGVPGASVDIRRVLVDNTNQTARYKSALKSRHKVERAVTELIEKSKRIERMADNGDEIKARAYAEYVVNNIASHEQQYTVSNVARNLSDVGFAYHLVSVSYNLVNMTQVPLYTLPHIAGRHGMGAASAAMFQAYRDVSGPAAGRLFTSGMSVRDLKGLFTGKRFEARDYDVTDELVSGAANPMVKRLLRSLVDGAHIDVSLAADLQRAGARRSIGPDGKVLKQGRWDYVTEWMRMAPHLTEVMNRSVAATAAFNLEFDAGKKKGLSDEAAYQAAERYAIDTLNKTQFVYAPWNRAPVQRNQWARLALMFMQHSQNATYNLLRYMYLATPEAFGGRADPEARAALGYFVGLHIMAVGAIGGIPEIAKPFVAMAGMLLGNEEEDWRLQVRNAMADVFGPELGQVASHGGLSLLGVDATTRLGIDSLLLRSQGFGDANSAVRSMVETFGGPLAGLGIRSVDAITYHRARGDWWKFTEAVAPKGFRDLMQVVRTNMYGETDRSGRQFIAPDELSAWEYVVMGMGFNPMTRADASIARSANFQYRRVERQRQVILDRAFTDMQRGRGLGDTRKRVAEFNRRHPQVALNMASVHESLRRRRQAMAREVNYNFVTNQSRGFISDRTRFLN